MTNKYQIVLILLSLIITLLYGPKNLHADGFIYGIVTHLTHGKPSIEKTLNMIATAGATSIRDNATWSVVEKRKGILRIPKQWDDIVNEALIRHIEPLLILDYGNRFYDKGKKPYSPQGIAAFTRYAKFVVNHFKGRVIRYEIWNEWEYSTGHTLPGSAINYVKLVRSVYPAIKRVDPKAKILVGAVGPRGIRNGFLKKIIKYGVLNYTDNLSLHTYVHCRGWEGSNARAWARWMVRIEEQLTSIRGKPVPFYITEMGWPSSKGKCGVTEAEQAEYLSQMFSKARKMSFVKGVWWYDFRNDGSDPGNMEHNFGLVRNDFSEKPAYLAFKKINKTTVYLNNKP